MKKVRVFLADDTVDLLGDYSEIPTIKEIETEDDNNLWGEVLKIDKEYYHVCCSQGENYGVEKLKEYKGEGDIKELEEFAKNEITCPVCGYKELDSREYSENKGDNHECGRCMSILSWSRDITIDYTTTVIKANKVKEL